MCTANFRNQAGDSRRAAFTLIELLVTIVIIGLLMALLIPAISSVRQTAQVGQVRTEISALTTAMEDFKATFGIYPPSSLTIYEAADDGNPEPPDDPAADWGDNPESRALIRRLWPQFDFDSDRNLNGDADNTDIFTFNGSECLVFFLGGIFVNGAPTGFSANPADPFSTGGNNRIGPFHEFAVNRFVDVDTDELFEYVDTLPGQTAPYLYFSSYNGTGYRALGTDGQPGVAGTDDDGANGIDDPGEIGWPTSDDETLPGAMAEVYLQTAAGAPWNPKTFQLISAGFDGSDVANPYGAGGLYNPDTADGDLSGSRNVERDNITNFESGMLAP